MRAYRLALLVMTLSALDAGAARADILYNNPNFPPGDVFSSGWPAVPASSTSAGNTDAWTLNFGFTAGSSFVFSAPATVTGVDFGANLTLPTDTLQTIDWAIVTNPNGGSTLASGGPTTVTQNIVATNLGGDALAVESFSIPATLLGAGTYWLELNNAVVTDGHAIYWDQGGGTSMGWSLGFLEPPAEGFLDPAVEEGEGWVCADGGDIATSNPDGSHSCGMSFDLTGTTATVPEPASLTLLAAGLFGVRRLRWRRTTN